MSELTEEQVSDLGYHMNRRLPSGTWIGVMRMTTTFGLFVGISELSYERRYCYQFAEEAVIDMGRWQEKNPHPPGNWIKMKGMFEGQYQDLLNPNLK